MSLSVVAVLRVATLAAVIAAGASASAQSTSESAQPPAGLALGRTVQPPAGYVIGPPDVLGVLFWRERDLSGDVAVRPDGMITLPLLNDIPAAGLTPEELRERVTEEASKYVEDPNVTIVVREINSRNVFITGQVAKPGPYALMAPTTVMQLIALAGGLHEYADQKNIVILRQQRGVQTSIRFSYHDIVRRRHLQQNIELQPGDTVVVR